MEPVEYFDTFSKTNSQPSKIPEQIIHQEKSTDLSASINKKISADSLESSKLTLKPNQTPQIFINQEGKIVVIKPAPPITKLTLQGGGPKGLAYGEYILKLNNKYKSVSGNFLEGLKDISGSSAGAMMSYLLAAGVPIKQVDSFIKNVNMQEELKGNLNVKGLETTEKLTYEAGNIIVKLRNMAIDSVNQYASRVVTIDERIFLAKSGFKNSQVSTYLIHLKNLFVGGVTFGDLAILHALNPSRFKRLHLTGCTEKTYEIRYYNSLSEFDMPAHAAVRISMSLPFFLSPVKWKGEVLSDGGQASNVPVEAFEKGGIASTPGDLLVLVFKNEQTSTDSNKILYGSKRNDPQEPDVKQMSTINLSKRAARIQITDKWDNDKIYAFGPSVGVVPHGKLTTTSFWAEPKEIQKVFEEVELAVNEFCKQRANQAIVLSYDDEIDLIKSLTREEKGALLQERKIQLAEFKKSYNLANKKLLHTNQTLNKMERNSDYTLSKGHLKTINLHKQNEKNLEWERQKLDLASRIFKMIDISFRNS